MKRLPPADNVRNVKPQGNNLRFKLLSPTGRRLQAEFWRERKFLYVLSREQHTVADIISQPEWFEYLDHKGDMLRHVPDYKVIRINGHIELHDVVRREFSETPGAKARERAMSRICEARGWCYQVHVEEQMATDTEIANLQALSAYKARVHARPEVEAAARRRLESTGPRIDFEWLTYELARELGMPSTRVMSALGHMLWQGTLLTDILTRLIFRDAAPQPGTMVWLPTAPASLDSQDRHAPATA
ncbi:MAG TPA: hypothetical protein VF914_00865 [Chloroflexia bacterium]|jgi:hypothetical protein